MVRLSGGAGEPAISKAAVPSSEVFVRVPNVSPAHGSTDRTTTLHTYVAVYDIRNDPEGEVVVFVPLVLVDGKFQQEYVQYGCFAPGQPAVNRGRMLLSEFDKVYAALTP